MAFITDNAEQWQRASAPNPREAVAKGWPQSQARIEGTRAFPGCPGVAMSCRSRVAMPWIPATPAVHGIVVRKESF
jgi:hypothetical protein